MAPGPPLPGRTNQPCLTSPGTDHSRSNQVRSKEDLYVPFCKLQTVGPWWAFCPGLCGWLSSPVPPSAPCHARPFSVQTKGTLCPALPWLRASLGSQPVMLKVALQPLRKVARPPPHPCNPPSLHIQTKPHQLLCRASRRSLFHKAAPKHPWPGVGWKLA